MSSPTALTPPAAWEFSPFYAGYVARVAPLDDVGGALAEQRDRCAALFAGIPEDRLGFRYAAGKWTVQELLGHMADAERVFAYRLLRIGRGDATPLAGFDQEPWVRAARYDRLPAAAVLTDWRCVREATLSLVRGFPPEAWAQRGVANGSPISARALVYVILGHTEHHVAVLRERYGVGDS